nr:unnamed protein product [Spirometra erinaceieuropaei]
MLRGRDCCLASSDFFVSATTTSLRGHPLKVRVSGARVDARKFFFIHRVIKTWNALLVDAVMSSSVDTFQRKLDQYRNMYHHVFTNEQIFPLVQPRTPYLTSVSIGRLHANQ